MLLTVTQRRRTYCLRKALTWPRRFSSISAASDAASRIMAGGQWQLLHRPRDARLRPRDPPRALLHAGAQPGVQRHRRSLREDLQARLRSPQPQARRRRGHGRARCLVRGLQRDAPAPRPRDALTSPVHQGAPTCHQSGRNGGNSNQRCCAWFLPPMVADGDGRLT